MNVLLIARRDLAAYLHGVWGWAIVAAVLFIDGLLFNVEALGGGAKLSHEVLERFFYLVSGTTMIAAPLLTMRSFAEERQNNTAVLLDTSPITNTEIVIGKYLAALGMMSLLTLLTLYMPLLIFVNGKVALAHIGVGYLGLLLLASAASAIGLFGSSLVRSQVIAVILSASILVALLLCWLLASLSDPPFSEVIASMAMHDKHFLPFSEGRLVSSNVVYYASVTYVFLMLTTRVLSGRRWQ